MNEIKFGSIIPLWQPLLEDVKQTFRVATNYQRAIDGTLVVVGPVLNYRQWRVILPCGPDFGSILALVSGEFLFTDLEGETATVRIVSLGESSEPLIGVGKCEIVMEETTPWNGSITIDTDPFPYIPPVDTETGTPVDPGDTPEPESYVLPETVTADTPLIYPIVSSQDAMDDVWAICDDNFAYTEENEIDFSVFTDEEFAAYGVSDEDKASFLEWLEFVGCTGEEYGQIFSVFGNTSDSVLSVIHSDYADAFYEQRLPAGGLDLLTSGGVPAITAYKFFSLNVWLNGGVV